MWMNLTDWLLSKRSQMQKNTYCMVPRLWSSRTGKIKMIEIGIAALWVGEVPWRGLETAEWEGEMLYICIWMVVTQVSVQFSRSVISNSLRPHESQHARPPCPSPTPGVDSNSCPSSQWCHPTISSSVVPFSSCPQSFPASGSFQMSQLFTWGGQSIGVSASASVLPMNIQDWSPLGWTGWISLQSKWLQHHSSKAPIFRLSAFFTVQLSHPYMTTEKTIAFTRWIFVGKVMCLL